MMKNSLWKVFYFIKNQEESRRLRKSLKNSTLLKLDFDKQSLSKFYRLSYGDVVFVYVNNVPISFAMIRRTGKDCSFKSIVELRSLKDLDEHFSVICNNDCENEIVEILQDEVDDIEKYILKPIFSMRMERFVNLWNSTYREYKLCQYGMKRTRKVYNYDAPEVQNLVKGRKEIKALGDAMLPWRRMSGSGFSKS